ncbi:hypothetical protein K438DRAFT_1796335 [Mycena galopus ATCC 62051]|nr:hypothetical protein K438DRAFT_1796335 [Mycena galopus ATCC 62051]
MRLLTFLSLSALLTTAFAQSAYIGAPANGSTVHRGSNITVEIDRPDTLTGSTEIAIVIGLLFCGGTHSTCLPPSSTLGTILYSGGYDPEFYTGVAKPPHQNFTVEIPSTAQVGKSQLGLAHFSLVGASEWPVLETRNITLNVV